MENIKHNVPLPISPANSAVRPAPSNRLNRSLTSLLGTLCAVSLLILAIQFALNVSGMVSGLKPTARLATAAGAIPKTECVTVKDRITVCDRNAVERWSKP